MSGGVRLYWHADSGLRLSRCSFDYQTPRRLSWLRELRFWLEDGYRIRAVGTEEGAMAVHLG